MNGEPHPLSLSTRQRRPSRLDLLCIRIERIDAFGTGRDKPRQPTLTAADFQNGSALQPDERRNPSLLNSIPIYNMHALKCAG